jgi:hypothetical protein
MISLGCTQNTENPVPSSSFPSTTSAPTSSPTSTQGGNPPVAKFSFYPEEPKDVHIVRFTNESTDPDDDPLRFEWYVDGQYNCSCFSISERFTEGGHTVELIAKDPQGNQDRYEVSFSVSNAYLEVDLSTIVLRREDLGMMWGCTADRYLGENEYRTVLLKSDQHVECTVKKYETVDDAKTAFQEIFVADPFPYGTIGNETTFTTLDDTTQITFRYGNLICILSANTVLDTVLIYAKSLESKLNKVGQ